MSLLLRNLNTKCYITTFVSPFSTSSARNLDQQYRKEKELPENPNRNGPLTTRRDYSFADGRPVPIGVRLRTRMHKQFEQAREIFRKVKEVDFAVDRYKGIIEQKERKKQIILDRKLNPKGNQLLMPCDKQNDKKIS